MTFRNQRQYAVNYLIGNLDKEIETAPSPNVSHLMISQIILKTEVSYHSSHWHMKKTSLLQHSSAIPRSNFEALSL